MTSKSKVTLTFAGDADQLNKVFRSVDRSLGGLEGRFGKFGKAAALGGAAIAGMAVAGGTALVRLGQDFDRAYNTIITGTGATGKALDGLQDSFKNVLKTGPDSMDAVATAIADLNTATGQVGKPLEDLSRQFLDLSRITKTDLGGNIKSVTRLFGDWGIAVEDQSETLDKLFVVSQNTGIAVDQLADKAVKAGAPFRTLGFTLDQQIALLGSWEKAGVNVDIVLSGMRQNISKLARAGEDIPSTFVRIVESIENAGSASEAASIAIEAFGAEAGPDMAAAIREGRFEIDDLVAALEDAEGQVGRTAEATETFGDKWETFKNKLKVALEPAAVAALDKLEEFFDWAAPKIENDVIPAIENFWDTFTKKGGEVKQFIERDIGPVLTKMFDDLDRNFKESEPKASEFFDALIRLYETFAGDAEKSTNDHIAKQESSWNRYFRRMLDGHANQRDTIFSIGTDIANFMTRWSEGIKSDLQLIKDFFSRWGDGMSKDFERIKTAWSNATANLSIAWRTFAGMMSGTAAMISSALSGVAEAIGGPFRDGYLKAVTWANKIPGISIKGPTVQMSGISLGASGAFRSSGGRSISSSRPSSRSNFITRRHAGGQIPGPMGRETPVVAKAGEHVVTANQWAAMNRGGGSGGAPFVIRIDSGGSQLDDVMVQILRKSIANRGGSVQAVLG